MKLMIRSFFRNSKSIKNKLMLVTSFATGFSLFLVLIIFIFLNSESEWSKLNTRQAIQAEIIATNSLTAIIFDDLKAAEEILAALKADPSIQSAKIVDSNSATFASYQSANNDKQLDETFMPLAKWLRVHILIKHEIIYKEKSIGKVHITASLNNLYRSNLNYVLIAFFVSLSSMFLTMLLSNLLLKHIIAPILKLTKTTKKITHLSSYKLRAEILSKDEIGDLTHNFNEMLEEIQRKDRILEQTVATRTSELIQLNKKLQHQATHDPLTGLANRLLFDDRLQRVLTHAQRTRSKVAVIYLDLDHFKAINDTLGHDTGDELLIAVTQRMQNIIRDDDTLCRIGGDEFTVILNSIESTSDVELVAKKMLSEFSEPFFCNDHELSISCSIGISLYPEHSQSAEQLKQYADIAMYHAKHSGRNNYCFFIKQMHKENVQLLDKRVLLKRQLKTAVENGELKIYYQPQVDMQHRIIAVEALLRWKNAENQLVSPEIFIPIAEESGLIQGLEEWAFREICQHYAKWKQAGLADIKISLNISGYRLRQQNFNLFIEQTLEELSLPTNFLIFEISENEIMQNIKETEKVINQLHNKGIKTAVDHFGTGYTSLSYLQQLPIDEFKIDAQFIHPLGSHFDDNSIVPAIIGLAHSLNKSVTAMGIEKQAQVDYLRDLKCQAMQGYLFSKPMSEQDMSQMLLDTQYLIPRNES